MVTIALDPTPFHPDHELLELPDLVARAGYEHFQLAPHPDVAPFFRHPKADDALVAALRRKAADAGVTITSLLPVQRISWPHEEQRLAAVRNLRRVLQIAVDLGVSVVNTEFSGRPELSEDSEAAFYRSMEEIVPVLEREGLRLNVDPHPDDFVEDALEAWRVVRGLNTDHVGVVYVASHTFHYGDRATTLLPQLGDRLGAVYAADTFDHRRSHGLRYISNPPGNAARVHQHLRVGDGDVDWAELFSALRRSGFLDREDALVVSNVFAEDETAMETSAYQLATLRELVARA
ncbi:sugar phosphate isomerase/epimerase family protein [Kineococcus aurantiacus]|uniref:Myo-inositol catabolism protein IolH n=1 Tax=Kineococcus aurantiacus TaxID=37633 RepID=A0A7Y9DN85_9ACTN|nr:sugar phosphate isomerase/epimerase family protein [Kineococcus aurantiacus]NYD23726.1 myo-inositol catabolism protein IolH [Kineococcus aurantiacus]